MRTFALLFCLIVFPAANLRADDACCESKSVAIQEKIRDIDLTIALKKYEQIQTEKAKAEVQLILIESQGSDLAKEIEMLQRRISNLQNHASIIKQEMLQISKEVEVASAK